MWLKAVIGTSAAVLSVGFAGFALGYWLKSGPRQVTRDTPARSTQVACSLSVDERENRRQKLASFWARARDIRELDDGFAFRFAFDLATLAESTRLISDESRCCSFFDFRLTVRPSDDLLLMEVTGPVGAKELLAASVRLDSAGEEIPLARPGSASSVLKNWDRHLATAVFR
ncbi:MAG: hypothetical protein WD063_17940, partial [Pirellulales bacterium]